MLVSENEKKKRSLFLFVMVRVNRRPCYTKCRLLFLTDALFLLFFPQLKYNAPGAPELAKRVKQLLQASGFSSVKEDPKRGLDHGAWVPLYLMYPDLDIPVCQLSVQPYKDGHHHYEMGKALAPLRDEGVLIMASGSATHNLRTLAFDNSAPPKYMSDFDRWLNDCLVSGR